MDQTRDSIADVWGERKPFKGEWPVRIDQQTTEEPDHWVQSACVLCSNGCGIDIGVKEGRHCGCTGPGSGFRESRTPGSEGFKRVGCQQQQRQAPEAVDQKEGKAGGNQLGRSHGTYRTEIKGDH